MIGGCEWLTTREVCLVPRLTSFVMSVADEERTARSQRSQHVLLENCCKMLLRFMLYLVVHKLAISWAFGADRDLKVKFTPPFTLTAYNGEF